MNYKVIFFRIIAFIITIAVLMSASLVAYFQLSHSRSEATTMETDVKTKDITITSEKDTSTNSFDADSEARLTPSNKPEF